MRLFVFGIGYSAGAFLRQHAGGFEAVAGTVRSKDKAEELAASGIRALVFDESEFDPSIAGEIEAADAILVSVQPDGGRDPVLNRFGTALAAAPRLRCVVYLSTIGVYGDHDGAWIDETTPARPESERGRRRLAVEAAWLALARPSGRSVSVLRLAGIYGPGRNVLDDLRDGTARRIDKAGQVFNRIHVEDIGTAIAGALSRQRTGIWNIADDEPAPASDVVSYGAKLLNVELPPLVPFKDAELSPMARSFYGANRRVHNRAMKRDLGVALRYPTYRQGLEALLAEQKRSGAAEAEPRRG